MPDSSLQSMTLEITWDYLWDCATDYSRNKLLIFHLVDVHCQLDQILWLSTRIDIMFIHFHEWVDTAHIWGQQLLTPNKTHLRICDLRSIGPSFCQGPRPYQLWWLSPWGLVGMHKFNGKTCQYVRSNFSGLACDIQWCLDSKKSPTGPTERTPKPKYLISLATYLGVRW